MISVTVTRQPADKPAATAITDPLITADNAARERGRNEIDHNSTNRVLVSLTGPYRTFHRPGQLVEYHGRRETWRGMILRSAVTLTRDGDSFGADMALELEREP